MTRMVRLAGDSEPVRIMGTREIVGECTRARGVGSDGLFADTGLFEQAVWWRREVV